MTLIKSISGIRGTIGGAASEGLNPISTAQFTAAYATFIRKHSGKERPTIVVGRDARLSGIMVKNIVIGTLLGMGCDVIDIDLATTPTTEMAVAGKKADGGLILTASHNPKQWNALKLLNNRGEFLSDAEGKEILRLAETMDIDFAPVDQLGRVIEQKSYLEEHIQAVLRARGVDAEAIRKAGFRVAFDRLAIVDEHGAFFGEEYTLVSIADYLLGLNGGGNTVSNLSSTRALRDVTLRHGGSYYAAAVGEVNVVTKMKEVNALIGGEGNGGVIYPELHYGRDALVGIALFLTMLAKSGRSVSELRATYPSYYMSKQRVELTAGIDPQSLLDRLAREEQGKGEINLIDGVKIDFADRWVHVRRSNTEPIIRIYTEAPSAEEATALADEYKQLISSYLS